MYSFKPLVVLALPLVVVATPLVPRTDSPSTCNSGSVQCCDSTTQASNMISSFLLDILGISPGSLIGLQCNPISIVGAAGNQCDQQTVCCSNNNFDGAITLGCTPLNLGL